MARLINGLVILILLAVIAVCLYFGNRPINEHHPKFDKAHLKATTVGMQAVVARMAAAVQLPEPRAADQEVQKLGEAAGIRDGWDREFRIAFTQGCVKIQSGGKDALWDTADDVFCFAVITPERLQGVIFHNGRMSDLTLPKPQ